MMEPLPTAQEVAKNLRALKLDESAHLDINQLHTAITGHDALENVCKAAIVQASFGRIASLLEDSMPLPLDADGVPWRIGDYVDDGWQVIGFRQPSDGRWYIVYPGADHEHIEVASEKRHDQPDSWERIIEDAYEGAEAHLEKRLEKYTTFDLITRCKKLAGKSNE